MLVKCCQKVNPEVTGQGGVSAHSVLVFVVTTTENNKPFPGFANFSGHLEDTDFGTNILNVYFLIIFS